MLYIFAGFPGKGLKDGNTGLHAGGLQHCIEVVERLGLLEHDPAIQYRKEGVFIGKTEPREWVRPIEYRVSEQCLQDGITWDWFPEQWSFGNGVTMHKTLGSPEYRTFVDGTGLTLIEFERLMRGKAYRLGDLVLIDEHWRHEGWEKYEARWRPGTCPQENHIVHLTWLVTTHKLPEFAYIRIRDLVERGAEPENLQAYDPKNHLSVSRKYDGRPTFVRLGRKQH